MSNIVVIIPTYNEKENIEEMLNVLEKDVFPHIKNHEIKILVADDKSPDGTAEIVKASQKKLKNIELIEGNKEGLGAAYIRAFKYAMENMRADAVIELDSDFQHDPKDIIKLVKAYDEGADYVIGSRYIKGGKIPSEWGLYRKFVSIFGSLFARFVLFDFKIHDMTSGYKLTSTKYLKKVDLDNLYSKYYAYKIHILHDIAKNGARVKEVPIVFYEREKGSSKLERKDLFDSFFVVLKLRIRDSKSFIKFLIVGGFGFIINAVILQVLVQSFNWNPSLANLVGAAFAIFSNYNLNNLWTFRHEKINSLGMYLWKMLHFYATSAFGVIFIQTGTIFLGDTFIGRQYYFIYFLIGTGFLLIWNFTIYSKVIWKKKK
jgi:dolichol-phosphate mannosyltransferase